MKKGKVFPLHVLCKIPIVHAGSEGETVLGGLRAGGPWTQVAPETPSALGRDINQVTGG